MIRRISKHNDLKDYIKSCPSGVIDDIYKIEYYIQGYNTVIECSFIKSGELLEVTLPTSLLGTLQNGILMRRAYYKVVDSSYPDGYYNLEFEDCMNIWLGDYESEEPIIPEYVTEEELASELTSYATKDWVDSQQFLTSETIPSDIATQSWVQSQGYLTASTIPSDIATEEWVRSQGYLTASTIPSDIATQSWVSSYFYTKSYIDEVEINNDIRMKAIEVSLDESYATMSWVQSQGYITVGDIPSGLATQSWVESYTYDKSLIGQIGQKATGDAIDWVQSQGYITVGDIPSGLATQSWVESYTYDKSLIDALVGKARVDALSDAQEWVSSQQFATQSWVSSNFLSATALEGYATESWVQSQGYLTSHQDLTGYATESWVSSNFLSSGALSGYATEQFVTSSLSGYATESWVSAQDFLEESKVWVGTREYWEMLTSEEQAAYKIALVTG